MKCIGCRRWSDEIPERVMRFPGGLGICASCLISAHDYLFWRVFAALVRPDEWEGGIL